MRVARIAGFTVPLGASDWVERLMSPPPAILNGVSRTSFLGSADDVDQYSNLSTRPKTGNSGSRNWFQDNLLTTGFRHVLLCFSLPRACALARTGFICREAGGGGFHLRVEMVEQLLASLDGKGPLS